MDSNGNDNDNGTFSEKKMFSIFSKRLLSFEASVFTIHSFTIHQFSPKRLKEM